jgi:hypothetical protein
MMRAPDHNHFNKIYLKCTFLYFQFVLAVFFNTVLITNTNNNNAKINSYTI